MITTKRQHSSQTPSIKSSNKRKEHVFLGLMQYLYIEGSGSFKT